MGPGSATTGLFQIRHPAFGFETKGRSLVAIERAKDDPFALGRLVLALETLPASNRMQPYTATQLALALGLARFLADYDAGRIPDERKIQLRRLAVVAAAV